MTSYVGSAYNIATKPIRVVGSTLFGGAKTGSRNLLKAIFNIALFVFAVLLVVAFYNYCDYRAGKFVDAQPVASEPIIPGAHRGDPIFVAFQATDSWSSKPSYTDVAKALTKQNVNKTDASGWTPLHWAAYYGDQNMVDLMLDKGADTTIKALNGEKAAEVAARSKHETIANLLSNIHTVPLFRAIEKQDETALQAAINGGGDVETKNADGKNVMMLAIEKGWVGGVKLLLPHMKIPQPNPNLEITTLLHLACDNLAIMEILLGNPKMNALVNQFSEKGTPLSLTTNSNIQKLLIDKGATLDAKGLGGVTLLEIAANGSGKISALLQNGAQITDGLLHKLVTNWDKKVGLTAELENLFEKYPDLKAQISKKDSSGLNPLHIALSIGGRSALKDADSREKVCQALVKAGAPVFADMEKYVSEYSTSEKNQFNALKDYYQLRANFSSSYMKSLIDHNGYISSGGEYGRLSPLHIAAYVGDYAFAIELIKAGCDPDLKTGYVFKELFFPNLCRRKIELSRNSKTISLSSSRC